MKKVSIFLDFFLKKLETGSSNHIVKAAGTIAPATEKRNIVVFDKPNLKPKGIANFKSKKGVMAEKNTASSDVIYSISRSKGRVPSTLLKIKC